MPKNKSPIKRLRRDEKRRLVNKSRISRIRTFVKNFEKALQKEEKEEKDVESLNSCLQKAQSELAKGVAKGIIHKNMAARKTHRLMLKFKKLAS